MKGKGRKVDQDPGDFVSRLVQLNSKLINHTSSSIQVDQHKLGLLNTDKPQFIVGAVSWKHICQVCWPVVSLVLWTRPQDDEVDLGLQGG